MKHKITFLSACLSLLAACGAPQADNSTQPAADSVVTSVEDSASPAPVGDASPAVAEPQAEDVQKTKVAEPHTPTAIDSVLALLAKENIGGTSSRDLWQKTANWYGNQQNTDRDIDVQVKGNAASLSKRDGFDAKIFEVGIFKNPNGSFQVVVFDNSGIDMHNTQKSWSYIFDGNKLTANKVVLPKPKIMDFIDEVALYGITDQKVLNKAKNGCIEKYPQYRNNVYMGDGSKLEVLAYLEYELDYAQEEAVDGGEYFICNSLLYDWDGQKFVLVPDQKKKVHDYDRIGNLRVGDKYNGQPVGSYQIKPVGAGYEFWKNDEKYFSLTTENGIIKSYEIFTDKFEHN